jgi:hypothetical protein
MNAVYQRFLNENIRPVEKYGPSDYVDYYYMTLADTLYETHNEEDLIGERTLAISDYRRFQYRSNEVYKLYHSFSENARKIFGLQLDQELMNLIDQSDRLKVRFAYLNLHEY